MKWTARLFRQGFLEDVSQFSNAKPKPKNIFTESKIVQIFLSTVSLSKSSKMQSNSRIWICGLFWPLHTKSNVTAHLHFGKNTCFRYWFMRGTKCPKIIEPGGIIATFMVGSQTCCVRCLSCPTKAHSCACWPVLNSLMLLSIKMKDILLHSLWYRKEADVSAMPQGMRPLSRAFLTTPQGLLFKTDYPLPTMIQCVC